MCTQIATKTPVSGTARSGASWVPVDEAIVTCDHATRLWAEHAVRLDFTSAQGEGVAVELDLDSGRALLERLREVIAAAESAGVS